MSTAQFSARRRQVLVAGAAGIAAPAAMAAAVPAMSGSPMTHLSGGKIVVSGRVVSAHDGRALAGAQIELWHLDTRGVRVDATHEVVTADGDGRYFAALNGSAQRVVYRVSHKGYTAKLTQLHASGTPQRAVSLTRDDTGTTRAAFEMKLAPRKAVASGAADVVAL